MSQRLRIALDKYVSPMVEWLKRRLFRRRMAYQQTFDHARPSTRLVLADLAYYCRAHATTMHNDPRAQAMLEGRRDVWLRIAYHLDLTDEQFWDLYGAGRSQEDE